MLVRNLNNQNLVKAALLILIANKNKHLKHDFFAYNIFRLYISINS